MPRAERQTLLRRIEEARGSRVLCYLTSDRENAPAQMNKDVLPLFNEHLRGMGRIESLDVFLVTLGGDTLAAFGLNRLAREFAPSVSVLAPEKCHSAGTLFALGAKQIVMTRLATLSPIDPSIGGPLNPVVEMTPGQRQLVPLSVESVAGYKGLVIEDWGVKGEEALAGAFRILAERVHPLALGDVFRRRQQIENLARKLLHSHRTDVEGVETVVQVLTKRLGSHDYLISRTEARELLGNQIAPENEAVETLLHDLFQDFIQDMELGQPFDAAMAVQAAKAAAEPLPKRLVQRLAVVESVGARHSCERELSVSEFSVGTPMGVQTGTRQEILRAGWTREA